MYIVLLVLKLDKFILVNSLHSPNNKDVLFKLFLNEYFIIYVPFDLN